jgi:polyferredoxin
VGFLRKEGWNLFSISLYDVVLWALAGAMAYATSLLLKWAVRAREKKAPLDTPFIIFILIMMLAMVVSTVVYLLRPSTGLLLDLIVVNMFVMTGGVLPIFLIMSLKLSTPDDVETMEGSIQTGVPVNGVVEGDYSSLTPLVVTLVLLNEFFMGWALVLASQTGLAAAEYSNPMGIFSSIVNSYWFIFTMSAEMLLTTYFLRKEINRALIYVIVLQSIIMILSPTALGNQGWVSASIYGGGALMIGLFIYIFEHMARNSSIDSGLASYVFRLLGVYSLMMAGLFVWKLFQSGTLFSMSIVLEMIVYFYLILGEKQKKGINKSWLLDAKWTLGLTSMIFVAEYFMGGLLDVQIYGKQTFLDSLSLAPISGSALSVASSTLYNALVWFGTITGSAWFLIMMGIEMGALVVFKIGTTRELETKIRLVLVIAAYAIYAVLLPSFLIPKGVLPGLPFVGWSMGVGTAGAVAPTFLVAIAGTYIVSGVLSFLFGARQLCSVFCTAALMYQGTFYDKMKSFNRTSKVARRFLSSRLSNLYRLIFSIVWLSIFTAVGISYLDSIGVLNLSIFGTDPTEFLYLFYFNFLWYVVFITIPFVGTYACVSMGWCHWGTFNQLVSRLGFFKLTVKGTNTCVNCKTKDCAIACPVGLTDLPGKFISSGQFKSHKCIGVGDCATACPYQNIELHDIRHWVRGKIRPKSSESQSNIVQIGSKMAAERLKSPGTAKKIEK